MNQEARLRSRSASVQADATRSNEEAAAIASESATLIRASANGFKDKAARDAHIARSAALDRRVATFNAKSKQMRLSLADVQTSQAEYLRGCDGRSFYVEDRNFILAKRETASKSPKVPEEGASAPASN